MLIVYTCKDAQGNTISDGTTVEEGFHTKGLKTLNIGKKSKLSVKELKKIVVGYLETEEERYRFSEEPAWCSWAIDKFLGKFSVPLILVAFLGEVRPCQSEASCLSWTVK